MEYLKLFNTHTQYESYIGGDPSLPNVSHCIQEDEMHYNPYDYSRDYLTFEALESGTFKFSGATSANTLQYSLDDGETWTTLAHNTNTPTIAAGSNILWKGSGLTIYTSSGIGIFSSTGTFNVKGNIMSLHFGDDFSEQTSLSGKNNAYRYLFSGCTGIVSTEKLILPATTLANNCYWGMFYGCTSLTTAPELPAITLANDCYYYMFNGCTSLTTAPSLPSTSMTNQCYYYMFNGCRSLTTAPELPATTLASYCYSYMFAGCTSLTTAPALPATTLASYCYRNMFSGCTNLNYIKAMFTTTPSTTYTNNWVNGVAATGTFVKNSAAEWNVTGVNGIPSGWTVQTASS